MKRRLALVVPALAQGGGVPSVARFIHDVAVKSGRFEVQLVSLGMGSREACNRLLTVPSTWRRGPIAVEGSWDGLNFSHVGSNWAEIESQRFMPRKVLTHALKDCELIQVVSGSPAWAHAVVGLGKPVALQVATRAIVERRLRDAKPRSLVDWWRKAMTHVTDRFDDSALRAVDAVQVENPWMLDYAKQVTDGRNIDVRYAPPGIDTRVFHPLASRDLDKEPYVLCVARLDDPRKNIPLLVEAFARLSAGLRGRFKLVLAGSSPPNPDIWSQAIALGVRENVSFASNLSRRDLISLYQNASVFVLPSDEEGLGMVILEAMACGVPVVSTRSGGPDGIITDGQDGYLTPLNDPVEMAHRLEYLLTDAAANHHMGQAARSTIECRFDERVVGPIFLEIWLKLLRDN